MPSSGTRPTGAAGTGGAGGHLSSKAIAYLEAHQGAATYLLAATGSQTTAPIIIQTGRAVVTIGGFNGGDPAPTVSQLARLVSSGQLKYVLISSGGIGAGGPGGAGGSSQSITDLDQGARNGRHGRERQRRHAVPRRLKVALGASGALSSAEHPPIGLNT